MLTVQRLTELLKQKQYSPMSFEVQVPILYGGVNGMLDKIPVDKITSSSARCGIWLTRAAWEADFQQHLTSSQQSLLEKIGQGKMTPEIESEIKKVVSEHVSGLCVRRATGHR